MAKREYKMEVVGTIPKSEGGRKFIQVNKMTFLDTGQEYIGVSDCWLYKEKMRQTKGVFWPKTVNRQIQELLGNA